MKSVIKILSLFYLTSTAFADASAETSSSAASPAFSTYFANWAIYHQNNFSYAASDLSPIVKKLSSIMYSFLYFCPPPGTSPMPYWSQPPYGSCTDATAFQIMSVEPRDTSFFASIKDFQSSQPTLSFILSIGGWNFPSSYFSALAASQSARSTFAASAKQWLATSGANGIELDWESPCSSPREDDVEISCTDFDKVVDAGGSCPKDTSNIVLLYKELRTALGPSVTLSIASQASKKLEEKEGIAALFPILDRLNIMTYDYAVSDITSLPGGMSPNAPLFTPTQPGTVNMSIASTVSAYLKLGVPPSKIHIGIPLYGHSWFNKSLAEGGKTLWQSFGAQAEIQGLCCGPFASTYGARPGLSALQCGTLMYSEIISAKADLYYYDNTTQSAIAYFSKAGADGTPAGTWVSYNDMRSVRFIAKWAKSKGLGGVFVFDSSMDTFENGEWTYTLMNAIADQLVASSTDN
jgi:chitinase